MSLDRRSGISAFVLAVSMLAAYGLGMANGSRTGTAQSEEQFYRGMWITCVLYTEYLYYATNGEFGAQFSEAVEECRFATYANKEYNWYYVKTPEWKWPINFP